MSTQTVINIALGLAVAFLFYANQGQGEILARVESETKANKLLAYEALEKEVKSDVDKCVEYTVGKHNPISKGVYSKQQAHLLCLSAAGGGLR